MTSHFQENPPSAHKILLSAIVGARIKNIIRCSWDPFSSFDEYKLYNIAKEKFFRFTTGSVVFVLDNGIEIAFSSQEGLNSIVLWCERDAIGTKTEDYYRDDTDLNLIEVSDPQFTTEKERNLLGLRIVSVEVLKMKPPTTKYSGLPNEVGVNLLLEDGKSILLAHNLVQSSDSFAIAYDSEIPPQIMSELVFKTI